MFWGEMFTQGLVFNRECVSCHPEIPKTNNNTKHVAPLYYFNKVPFMYTFPWRQPFGLA